MIDRFVADYQHCSTPNPCVEATNGQVLEMLEQSAAFGANPGERPRPRRTVEAEQLLRGKDRHKDQATCSP